MQFATAGHQNYVSMDKSPNAAEVLIKLVNAGFVTRYATIEQAMRAFQGKEIVLSEMALITTVKKSGDSHIGSSSTAAFVGLTRPPRSGRGSCCPRWATCWATAWF